MNARQFCVSQLGPKLSQHFTWEHQEVTLTATLDASVQVTGTSDLWELPATYPAVPDCHVRPSDSPSLAVAAWIKVNVWPKFLVFEPEFWDSQWVFAYGCNWEDINSRPYGQFSFSHHGSKQSAEEEKENMYGEAEMRGGTGLSVLFFLSLVPLARGLSDLGLQETPRYLSHNNPFFLKTAQAGYLQ